MIAEAADVLYHSWSCSMPRIKLDEVRGRARRAQRQSGLDEKASRKSG